MLVPKSEAGQRLDRFLKNAFPQVPFVAIQKLIRSGQVRVDGKRALPNTRLVAGELLRLPPNLTTQPAPAAATPGQLTNADKALLKNSIVYEDDHLLVLNKPAGLATQAGNGVTRSLDRLLNLLYPQTPPKLTHRLDRDTTGLIVFAFTRESAANLTQQFAEHKIEKTYHALLTGHMGKALNQTHHIREALTKVGAHSKVGHIEGSREDEKPAHTSYHILRHLTLAGQALTLVAATPHTGRMNQLRVHFAHLGYPIVGDGKYGTPTSKSALKALHPTGASPLYLHAHNLTITHPSTQKVLALSAPIPPSWHAALL